MALVVYYFHLMSGSSIQKKRVESDTWDYYFINTLWCIWELKSGLFVTGVDMFFNPWFASYDYMISYSFGSPCYGSCVVVTILIVESRWNIIMILPYFLIS